MVFGTLQGIVLILLCFASLIIALYCLLFMVPLKRFVAKINSLGGGMKGIRAHVAGLQSETQKKIGALRESVTEELDGTRQELQDAVGALAKEMLQAQAGVQRLDRATHNLQAGLRDDASDVRKLSATVNTLRKEAAELRNDFEALEVELHGSVRQLVSDSSQQLEGTVLSALEAVQDEMLRGTRKLRASRNSASGPGPGGPRPRLGRPVYKGSHGRPSGKIVAAEPLFSELEKGQDVAGPEGGAKR